MAGRTKKRPRMPSAETSDSGEELIDIEEVNQPPHQTRAARGLDEQQALDEQELEKAHDVYTAQQSQCYAAYNPPYISERRGKNKHRMLACERPIHRPIYDTSPTNLSKHVVSCLKKQKDVEDSQKLAALGVSGTGDIDPRDVPQLCAIWCAEGAPLGEAGHIGIMHPTVVRNVPSRKVVSSEIGRLYTAVQESLIESLHKHTADGGYKLESMPLDFVRLKGSHTGVHLADTVRVVVEKFGVQNKAILRPFGSHQHCWDGLLGRAGAMSPWAGPSERFSDQAVRPLVGPACPSMQVTTFENEEYESDDEDLDADDQVKMFSPETESDQDKEDTGPLAAQLVEDDKVELDIEDVEELSNEEEDDVYTSESCRRTLAKFRAIARKLNKSPNSKTLFVDICQGRGCAKPHSIGRDGTPLCFNSRVHYKHCEFHPDKIDQKNGIFLN
ncbi:hypothetical protein Pst134EA_000239 [Puccinia striiformis f. sp. tritici]|uniref:hypothetical protein n=1 Tax=Puccinia striiformis f. sp. tritici TaxID=168172 RepID=UPI00200727C5|nr:hypothetical protein Pst134EA_000239 [Puccinia striiformis f. sp. tritici]KAH9473161.1 hypothetical protein Pst134EA_000239 [Puccinia striiformis f. sp. tritici]